MDRSRITEKVDHTRTDHTRTNHTRINNTQINLLFILIIFSAIFFCIFTSGCIEKNVLPSQNEIIERDRSIDTDGDGIPDQKIYILKESSIETIRIHKEIISERKVGNIVTVRLFVSTNASGKITDIDIKETIPSSLSRDINKIEFLTPYSSVIRQEVPITINWKFTFSGEEEILKLIEYKTNVYQEITKEWIEDYIKTPYVEVSIIDPKAVPIIHSLSKTNDGLLDFFKDNFGFYTGIGIYSAVILCIALILIDIFAVFGAFLSSMVKRTSFSEEVFNFLGRGRKESMKWFIAGIALIFAGAIITFVVVEVPGAEELSTLSRLGSNPINAIGSFFVLLGIISIYYIFADIVKGAVLGQRYFLSPINVANIRLKQLTKKLMKLEEKIIESAKEGIDTSTEEIIINVERRKVERIEREIDIENVEIFLPIIIKSISDVSYSIDSLESKGEILRNWPEWKRSVETFLETKEEIRPEMLTTIPIEWRKWTLVKYLSEHIGEALTIEDGALRRIKIAAIGKGEIDMVLGEFSRSQGVEGGAIIRKDGLTIGTKIPAKITVDPNIASAMAAKLAANAEMVSLELERGRMNFIYLKAGRGDTIIGKGKKIILLALISPGAQTGYIIAEMEKTMKKLDEMF